MKDILIDGHRILTTDEVADAVIEYARKLLVAGYSDIVEFPTVHDGELARCSLLLGSGSLAVVDAGVVMSSSFGDADQARAEIHRRADSLRSTRSLT
ncbi:hypothetical protein [Microbacterium invictum]|uniref:Uncharacterized protein n=1 Tax=Microbacterium invictum TaxID=515415 RepID=A0AA40SL97_9MICO|nr:MULTISPECIES: hypothetical protein [Microbacterium]MBB4138305.1 hypothetical protein [Microbacterium invictum]